MPFTVTTSPVGPGCHVSATIAINGKPSLTSAAVRVVDEGGCELPPEELIKAAATVAMAAIDAVIPPTTTG